MINECAESSGEVVVALLVDRETYQVIDKSKAIRAVKEDDRMRSYKYSKRKERTHTLTDVLYHKIPWTLSAKRCRNSVERLNDHSAKSTKCYPHRKDAGAKSLHVRPALAAAAAAIFFRNSHQSGICSDAPASKHIPQKS